MRYALCEAWGWLLVTPSGATWRHSTRGLITSPSVDPATAIERGRAATSPTPGDAFSTRVTIVPDSSRMPRTL
ncbi:hypothetical protein APB67_35070 [Pseudomonas aeruginosa]|nr:hypothetical protein APB67_35070 [Pseudomonas aeruginosa]